MTTMDVIGPQTQSDNQYVINFVADLGLKRGQAFIETPAMRMPLRAGAFARIDINLPEESATFFGGGGQPPFLLHLSLMQLSGIFFRFFLAICSSTLRPVLLSSVVLVFVSFLSALQLSISLDEFFTTLPPFRSFTVIKNRFICPGEPKEVVSTTAIVGKSAVKFDNFKRESANGFTKSVCFSSFNIFAVCESCELRSSSLLWHLCVRSNDTAGLELKLYVSLLVICEIN
uniref:Uncharacterized protein n=1 Tax=Glossina pallidipes TaxID=7398 RepID=A0A1A9ZVE4_GLOPL